MTAPSRLSGSGALMSSGTTVMGSGTKFRAELTVGDAIEVQHPASGVPEIRVVKMVLSDTSAGLNAAFSSNLGSDTPFRVLKLPKALQTAEGAAADASKRRFEEEQGAYGRYTSQTGKSYVYREKTAGGNYKVKTAAVDHALTREEALDMRSKFKGDKHC